MTDGWERRIWSAEKERYLTETEAEEYDRKRREEEAERAAEEQKAWKQMQPFQRAMVRIVEATDDSARVEWEGIKDNAIDSGEFDDYDWGEYPHPDQFLISASIQADRDTGMPEIRVKTKDGEFAFAFSKEI